MTPHPAPFPRYVLERLALILRAEHRRLQLGGPLKVLDPFAGIGRIHDLPSDIADTVGVELEPEWANQRERTIVGDATALPATWTRRFDAVVTSPTFGNRLADHHEAKDACSKCGGTGVDNTPDGCADAPMFCPVCGAACTCGTHRKNLRAHIAACSTCAARRCKGCHGTGLTLRHTYRHALGRPLSANNSGAMGWTGPEGNKYRDLHKAAWVEAFRVVRPGGLILVDAKNHVRQGVEQRVVEWHAQALYDVGFRLAGVDELPAPGIRHGANADKRVLTERIIIGRKPRTIE